MESAPYPASSPSEPEGPAVQAPGIEADDGVDLTLVRWALSLTPQERLDTLQANADALARFQDAASAQR